MRIKNIFGLLVFAVSFSAGAQANRQVTSNDDLIGCWSKIDFSEQAKAKINTVAIGEDRYQVFCFETDGTVRTIGSSSPIQANSAEVRAAFTDMPKVMAYQIVKPGVVVITNSETKQNSGWISSFTAREMQFDGKNFPKETLTMGLIDMSKQRAVYWRYLTPIQDEK